MERLALLACVVVAVVAEPITFKDCTDGNYTMKVDISPCPQQPCVFNYSSTATVNVTFKAPEDSSSLKAKIFGIVLGQKVGWPMPNPDGCVSCNIGCPVKAGQVYTYTNTLSVPKGAPKLRLVVEWSLTDANGKKQFCFDFPMEIS